MKYEIFAAGGTTWHVVTTDREHIGSFEFSGDEDEVIERAAEIFDIDARDCEIVN